MDTSALLQKTMEKLTPFETENIVHFMRQLTVKGALSNPWIVMTLLVITFYAVIRRSKFVLGALFTAAALVVLLHFTMPAEGAGLSLSSTIPFAFGGIAIGGVLIYLFLIKTE
jgi:hypothetical protein